jgi:hypothetical protein
MTDVIEDAGLAGGYNNHCTHYGSAGYLISAPGAKRQLRCFLCKFTFGA